jgi:hypothetical protein
MFADNEFMNKAPQKILIFMTVLMLFLLFTQAVFAEYSESRSYDYDSHSEASERRGSSSSNSAFSVDKIKKNNNAFHIEFSFTEIPVKPDIFYDESLNGDLLKLQGVNIGVAKSFALGSLLFVSFNLRGLQGTKKSTVTTSELLRNSTLVSYQGVAHIGFNIRSIMIDHASMHPFVGMGYYRSSFTDTYTYTDDTTDYNKIIESGTLAEFGVNFIDQYSGMFSTFKMGRFLTSSKTYESSIEVVQAGDIDLSIYDEGAISTSNSTYYSVGFGIKF